MASLGRRMAPDLGGGISVVRCRKAKLLIVLKRGQGTGHSGVENPLFYMDSTRNYNDDAKKRLEAQLPMIV